MFSAARLSPKIGLVGCGWLGRSVAIEILRNRPNLQLNIFDSKITQESRAITRSQMNSVVASMHSRGLIQDPLILNQASFLQEVAELKDSELVFECVNEDIFSKQLILCLLDSFLPPTVLILSAGLTCNLSDLSKFTKYPERIGICLWAQPVYFIPFIFFSAHKDIPPTSLDYFKSFIQSIGKEIRKVPENFSERLRCTLTHQEALSLQISYAQSINVNLGRVFGFTYFQRKNNFASPENESENNMVNRGKFIDEVTSEIVCIDISKESENFKTFTFKSVEQRSFHVVPGQVCKIQFNIDGNLVQRYYAVMHPTETTFSIGVQTNIGLVSIWLDTQMQVGVKAELVATFGNPFILEKSADVMNVAKERFLFIAGGTGITPLFSMIKWLGPLGANVILLYSVKGPEIPFLYELLDMMKQYPSFCVWINVTERIPEDLETVFPFVSGRISREQIRMSVPDVASRSFYILGPEVFMRVMKEDVFSLAQESVQNFLQSSRTGPDNQRHEDAFKCWQDAFPAVSVSFGKTP